MSHYNDIRSRGPGPLGPPTPQQVETWQDKVSLKPNGIIIERDLTFNEYQDMAQKLEWMESGVQWWLGDCANYGEDHYHEDYVQAFQETRAIQTVYNYAYVARKFDISRRREALTFSHHAECAGLEPEIADEFLYQAEFHGWSIRELRDAIKKREGKVLMSNDPLFRQSGNVRDLIDNLYDTLDIKYTDWESGEFEFIVRRIR
jgi:hypothetical protein